MNYYPARKKQLKIIESDVIRLMKKKEDEETIKQYILNNGAYSSEVEKVIWNANKSYKREYRDKIREALHKDISKIEIITQYENEVPVETIKELVVEVEKNARNEIKAKAKQFLIKKQTKYRVVKLLESRFIDEATLVQIVDKLSNEIERAEGASQRKEIRDGLGIIIGGIFINILSMFIGSREFQGQFIVFYGIIIYGVSKLVRGLFR